MSNLVPFTNETDRFVTVGLFTIPPGQTRSVEAYLHPDYSAPADGPADEQEKIDVSEIDLAMQLLLDGNVDSVLAAMADLPDEELERLGELEQLGKSRKGVLGAVAEHLLNRAGAANAEKTTGEGQ
jgi:hypothetical protein